MPLLSETPVSLHYSPPLIAVDKRVTQSAMIPILLLSIIGVWVDLAMSGSIAAWNVQGVPQIARQDDTTGNIITSLCNETGSPPVFPTDGSTVMDSFGTDAPYSPPNNRTPIAVAIDADNPSGV